MVRDSEQAYFAFFIMDLRINYWGIDEPTDGYWISYLIAIYVRNSNGELKNRWVFIYSWVFESFPNLASISV